MEIQRYLKTGSYFDRGKEVMQRNTDIVHAASTPMCVHICLFVLKSLASGNQFQSILNHMQHYGYPQGEWKDPFKPTKGVVLPRHRFTGPYNALHLQLDSKDNPLPGNEPYNAVGAISMRHDICYRDNPSGKHECDRKILAELNTLVPRRRREKVDRQLVRSIIGLKHKLGLGIWSNQLASELHKPVRRRFENVLYSLNKLMIYGLQIWLTVFQIEQGLQLSLDSNRCIQQVWLNPATENQDWKRSCTDVSKPVPRWSP